MATADKSVYRYKKVLVDGTERLAWIKEGTIYKRTEGAWVAESVQTLYIKQRENGKWRDKT
jgi:hypothetical protein